MLEETFAVVRPHGTFDDSCLQSQAKHVMILVVGCIATSSFFLL
jgi:hypothetical protein